MVTNPKPCKYCGSTLHQSWRCYKKPAKERPGKRYRAYIKTKVDNEWLKARRLWFKNNPPDHAGYYYCQIKPCLLPGVPMFKNEVELDHIIARSKDQSLKYEQSNLRPSHGLCNSEKGSLTDEQYREKIERINRTKNS